MALILIEKLSTRKNKNGHLESWGKYLCTFCINIIERRRHNTKTQKSCGCLPIDNNGLNNPMYGKIQTEETRQKMREAKLGKYDGKNNPMHGKQHTIETKQKQSIIKKGKYVGENNPNYGNGNKISGEKHWNWLNGKSFEPYPPNFNKELKQQILERDNYTCQCLDCDTNEETDLHIHHIDYDKKNNLEENLITLCNSCHSKTNGKKKRLYWIEFYQNIMMNKLMECLL